MNSDITIKHALKFAQRGWPIFPAFEASANGCSCLKSSDCNAPGKHPRINNWQSIATVELAKIQHWWSQWPKANIAIVTGPRSGFFVLDIDPRSGGDKSLEKLIAEHGALPETVSVLTGGGGRHFYFKMPEARMKSRTGVRAGIDIKADGGYIVAPFSNHVSGSTYSWAPDHDPDAKQVAHAPNWLLTLLNADSKKLVKKSSRDWHQLVSPTPVGERNDTIAKIAGHLLRRDVDFCLAHALMQSWNASNCQPPLHRHEVTDVVESIGKREVTRLLEKGGR